ncbi:FimD/PapC C-terminal domain-containing protein, partial [Escherichia coli]|uniref:FimD/PapC C-terminal domain-containing protein n=2 Tax=Escherichia coli TaxID=562 RepID=UPI0025A57A3E
RGIVFPGKSFFSAHEVSTCKISGCLSYRILDSGPDGTQTTLTDNVDLEQTTQFVVPNRGAMVAARFNANIGYRVLVTVSDRNGKPLPFGALASNDETGQQSIVDEGGILYLSGISSKSQSWTVRWGNQADQQCQFAFSTPDSEPTTSVLQGTAQCH